MSSTTLTRQGRRKQERNLREMLQIRCSLRWIGAGCLLGGLAASSIYAGGWPLAALWGAAGLAGLSYSTLLEPRSPRLERVALHLPSLPPELDGLRIGQISDMHLGYLHCHENTRWAVQQLLHERPDLIVITGDFVSFDSPIGDLPDLLRSLHAPLGVYAVTGNHDYWEGIDAIREQVESLGIEFLINTNRRLHWHGADLWLAGLDDMWYGTPDLKATLAGIPQQAFTILLAHEPDFADIAVQRCIDLQISGHTHGGHIDLPLLGVPCLPNHGLRYTSGLVQVGPMQVYVSRGLGGFPLRFNCPPEAAILTLKRG